MQFLGVVYYHTIKFLQVCYGKESDFPVRFCKEEEPRIVDARKDDTDSDSVLVLNESEEIGECCSEESSSDNEDDQAIDQTSLCGADCCSFTRDMPNQPTSKLVLAKTRRIQGRGKNKQGRLVQASWFKRHPWLTLCTTRQKLFCFYCSAAARKNLLVFSKNQDSAFISSGYCNWRKSSKAFLKHGYSSTHAEAVLKINSTQDIGSQLDYIHKEEQKARRESLLKQLSSLLFLLHQGLAIRGHNMEDGNLFQLLKLRSQDDPQLITWLNDHNYYSPDILSEQIELMAHSVLRGVLKEINSAGWFSILADEATDVKRCEQMCVCIRWVDDDYNVNEETIGLVISKTDSATLFAALHDVCIRCVLPLEKCRGQAYDGAALVFNFLYQVHF